MRYAFISGSTAGIGKAIGIKLLQEGFYVIFNYSHSENKASDLRIHLKKNNFSSFDIIKADLSQKENIPILKNKLLNITSKFDLLVFNAGATDRSEWTKIQWENWQKVMDVNVNIPLFILQSLSDNLSEKSSVIFIGSLLGEFPHATSLAYGVSKSAIHSLVKNLVKFFSSRNIRINGIAPGFVNTDWQKEKPDWLKEKINSKIALSRFAEPEEISSLAFHLVENEYINGQIIQIDGGYSFN